MKKVLFTFKWRCCNLQSSWRRAGDRRDVYCRFIHFSCSVECFCFTQLLRLIYLLHRRAEDFCFSPGWNVHAATIKTDKRCYCTKYKKGTVDRQKEYMAVCSNSLALGGVFTGEDSHLEVASITGSNKGVTTYGSEGDADNPTLVSFDINLCSKQTPTFISTTFTT